MKNFYTYTETLENKNWNGTIVKILWNKSYKEDSNLLHLFRPPNLPLLKRQSYQTVCICLVCLISFRPLLFIPGDCSVFYPQKRVDLDVYSRYTSKKKSKHHQSYYTRKNIYNTFGRQTFIFHSSIKSAGTVYFLYEYSSEVLVKF
jgi:hypothetical protein